MRRPFRNRHVAALYGPSSLAVAQINAVGFPASIPQLLVDQGAGRLLVEVDYTRRFVGSGHKGHLGSRRLALCLFDKIAQLPISILRKGFPSLPFFLLPKVPCLCGFSG